MALAARGGPRLNLQESRSDVVSGNFLGRRNVYDFVPTATAGGR
ncbi:hypothetical protein HMPREF0004_1982 [Achromobacter piechaudii ATCC 43553]|uniref:Uncharacterized protein n=1 Tax=Achromobacter piechaudii ATCC 43553 TaxID=742159 RepID=D4X935_9BURK|nr:hypothetical protein HMPREF0004_1982 [Achromobacter piechaudii ATCC 43553]